MDSTYAKAEVFVSLAVWEIAKFICKEPLNSTADISWFHRFWKWNNTCLMMWAFIYLFQQQTHFSGHPPWPHTCWCILLFSTQSFFFINILFLVFFNFDQEILRAVQVSCIVRSVPEPHCNKSFQFICIVLNTSCQTTFPGSFDPFELSGELSCWVDFNQLRFPEISSFSGSSIFSFPCKMDTWPIWPSLGLYENIACMYPHHL